MQALEWAVTYPTRLRGVAAIATAAAATAQQIAWSAAGRAALETDPRFRGGDYYDAEPGDGPHEGLIAARMLGMIHYRSDEEFTRRFARSSNEPVERQFALDHRFEVERYLRHQGLKLVRRICTTPPMRDYVAGEFLPGDKVMSDEAWLAYCREMGETVFHPASTCSMGPVVDSSLRVRGVQNLRVVDASVMPAVPSGNINAAVIAVAEKAADLLKQ